MRGSEVLLGSLLAVTFVGLEQDPHGAGKGVSLGQAPKASPFPPPYPYGGIRAVFGTKTDFSKALGTVSHDILLGRLRKCGINGLGGRAWLNAELRGA